MDVARTESSTIAIDFLHLSASLRHAHPHASPVIIQPHLVLSPRRHGVASTPRPDNVLIEEGVSGSVPVEERPIGGVLFAKLERGDIVIAAKLDRLFRSALDALKVAESLKGRGVKLHLLDLGGDIAGNGISKLFLTIAAAFAEAERDRIRARIGQAKADQKSRGRFLGGDVPFGFEVGADGALVPVEEQQAAIREIAALISHEGVARILKGRRAA